MLGNFRSKVVSSEGREIDPYRIRSPVHLQTFQRRLGRLRERPKAARSSGLKPGKTGETLSKTPRQAVADGRHLVPQ